MCVLGSFYLCVCVLSRPGALCKPSGAPSSVCVLFESVCWVIIEAIVCNSFQSHNAFSAGREGESSHFSP